MNGDKTNKNSLYFYKRLLFDEILNRVELPNDAYVLISWLKTLPLNYMNRILVVNDVSLSKHIISFYEETKTFQFNYNLKSPDYIFKLLEEGVIPESTAYLAAASEFSNSTSDVLFIKNTISDILLNTEDYICMAFTFKDFDNKFWYFSKCDINPYIIKHQELRKSITDKVNKSFDKPSEFSVTIGGLKLDVESVEVDYKINVETNKEKASEKDTTNKKIDLKLKLILLKGDLDKALEDRDYDKCKIIKDKITDAQNSYLNLPARP